jgi:hypothetical protein
MHHAFCPKLIGHKLRQDGSSQRLINSGAKWDLPLFVTDDSTLGYARIAIGTHLIADTRNV